MKHRQVTATDFKATCLALLDEVNESGGSVTITKRGKPVAVLQPVGDRARRSLRGILAGKVKILGDIVNTNFADDWDCVREADAAQAVAARRGRKKAC